MNTNTFSFKCPCCNMRGRYKTQNFEVAKDFRCPHDASKMIFQFDSAQSSLPDKLEEHTYVITA